MPMFQWLSRHLPLRNLLRLARRFVKEVDVSMAQSPSASSQLPRQAPTQRGQTLVSMAQSPSASSQLATHQGLCITCVSFNGSVAICLFATSLCCLPLT